MNSEVQTGRLKINPQSGSPGQSRTLATMYEDVFTVIVRIQARRQHAAVAETFRNRIKSALSDVERDATNAGYSAQDVRETHFAVVAFLDSVVLHSNDPIRPEWERQTLQEELFGQTDAGVVFFEKLEQFRSRRDSEQLADMLEVYLLCLLLGFEGRYSEKLRGELESTIEKLRRRIEDIRGRTIQISPMEASSPPATPSGSEQPRRADRTRFVVLALVALTLVMFIVWKLNLWWISNQVKSQLI
jgi:type VI secretion system protein ImpK